MIRRVTLFCIALLSLLLTEKSLAGTLVLRADGSGDVPTFQAGIDSLMLPEFNRFDTLLVEPGVYDEIVEVPPPADPYTWQRYIRCPGGPELTSLRGLVVKDQIGYRRDWMTVTGLSMQTRIVMGWAARGFQWYRCRFDAGVAFGLINISLDPNLHSCEFRGPVYLEGYVAGTGFDGCRFINAPLHIGCDGAGWVVVRDCIFESADTLVVARPFLSENAVAFWNCSFTNAKVAIVGDPYGGSHNWVEVSGCVFSDIEDIAILQEPVRPCAETGYCYGLYLNLYSSRFDRCGRAVEWNSQQPMSLSMSRDTVTATRGTAIEASGIWNAYLDGLTIENSGGTGIQLASSTARSDFTFRLSNSTIRGSAGPGLIMEGSRDAQYGVAYLDHCESSHNAADGARIRAESIEIENSVFSGNHGAGLIASYGSRSFEENEVIGNTATLNSGAGIIVQTDSPTKDTALEVANNLVAGNGGDGLAVRAGPSAETEHNDSWLNMGAPYVGFESHDNLEVDPRFCDPQANDFHVQASSPCAAGGPFGQIGALGAGCDVSHAAFQMAEDAASRNPNSNAAVEVTVLGSPLFPAARIDRATVRVQSVAPESRGNGSRAPHLTDVNEDGFDDLALTFGARQLAGLLHGTVRLEGATIDGVRFASGQEIDGLISRLASRAEPTVDNATMALAIRGSNPTIEGRLSFQLPTSDDAEIEIYDLAGRRVLAHRLNPGRAGMAHFDLPSALHNGVYLVRVTQDSRAVTRRLVFLR